MTFGGKSVPDLELGLGFYLGLRFRFGVSGSDSANSNGLIIFEPEFGDGYKHSLGAFF